MNHSHLSHSISVYETIRQRIVALVGDLDDTTLADTLEGETDLHEVVSAVVRSALVDEALADGMKGHMETMRNRLDRLKERAKKQRRLAKAAMIEVGLTKIVAPDFTLSVRVGAPALVVVDEAAIPDNYWVTQTPRLNRQGLLSDLKQGRPVDGVALSNPEPVLNVRVR